MMMMMVVIPGPLVALQTSGCQNFEIHSNKFVMDCELHD
jgi:hypothetical protein